MKTEKLASCGSAKNEEINRNPSVNVAGRSFTEQAALIHLFRN